MVGQSKQDISHCKDLRDVAIATKFWPNMQKSDRNSHTFSSMRHISAELGFERGFVPSGNSSVTLPYTRDMTTNFGTTIAINTFL